MTARIRPLRRAGRFRRRECLRRNVHRGERQPPQQPRHQQPPHARQAGISKGREQRAQRRQQTGRPGAALGVKPRDPAVTGDAHQPIGGEQQPGFGERHAERRMVERQQQIEQRVAGLGEGQGQRGVARVAVGDRRFDRRFD
jgi:hypothetical protein